MNSTRNDGLVTLKAKVQHVLPANGRVLLRGYAKSCSISECAIAEQPTTFPLPGGIFVECCLVTLPRQHPHRFPIWVSNEIEHDITLSSRCVIAELHTPTKIYDKSSLSKKGGDTVKCCNVTP